MSRHVLLSIATIFVSLMTLQEQSFGQYGPTQNYRSSTAGGESRSVRNRRQEENLASYRMRAPAAEAIAAGKMANAKMKVAGTIGRLQAAGDLRQAEANYAEICPETAKRKHVARRELASLNEEHQSWQEEQARKRTTERGEAALARLEDVRRGEWPAALMDGQYATMREQLSAAVVGREYLVAGGPEVDIEHALSVVAQMRQKLRGSIRTQNPNDYTQAARFLDELKDLTDAGKLADPSL